MDFVHKQMKSSQDALSLKKLNGFKARVQDLGEETTVVLNVKEL